MHSAGSRALKSSTAASAQMSGCALVASSMWDTSSWIALGTERASGVEVLLRASWAAAPSVHAAGLCPKHSWEAAARAFLGLFVLMKACRPGCAGLRE